MMLPSGTPLIPACVNIYAAACDRTRDCQNIEMGLFCRTRPIVESSVNVST